MIIIDLWNFEKNKEMSWRPVETSENLYLSESPLWSEYLYTYSVESHAKEQNLLHRHSVD